MKSRATSPWEHPLSIVDCCGYSSASVANATSSQPSLPFATRNATEKVHLITISRIHIDSYHVGKMARTQLISHLENILGSAILSINGRVSYNGSIWNILGNVVRVIAHVNDRLVVHSCECKRTISNSES